MDQNNTNPPKANRHEREAAFHRSATRSLLLQKNPIMNLSASKLWRWSCAASLLLGACRAPKQATERTPLVPAPAAWSAPLASPTGQPPATSIKHWWESFEDPGLNELVLNVLGANLDLQIAASRLNAAAAQARMAGAALWPKVNATGDAARSRQNFVGLPVPGAGGSVLSSNSTNIGVSLGVSWEIDLWGKLDARERSAAAGWQAGQADYVGAQLSLAGQAAKSWFALIEAREQLGLAKQTIEAYELSTAVLRNRFEQRGTAALDLRLAESQLASAKARFAATEESLARITRQIEALQGKYPAGLVESANELPGLPGALIGILPGELLRRRPDVVAAEHRLQAADLDLYAASKDVYPSISLGASAGRRGSDLDNLTDSDFDIWSLISNITVPIFEGGRLKAQIEVDEAEARAALQDWSRGLLQAFLEVETALAAESPLQRREAALAHATREAQAAQRLAEERYGAGRGDILTVLEARQRAFANHSAWIAVRRALFELRIDLYLALGGGFGEEPDQAPSDNTSAPGQTPELSQ